MKTNNLQKYLFSICVLLSILHTPYIATFTNFFPNYNSTPIAFNIKILIILTALVIIISSKKIHLSKTYILIVLLFLTTLLVSYFNLKLNSEHKLNYSLLYYYGHGLVIVAMITVIFCKYQNITNFKKPLLFLLSLFVLLIFLNNHSDIYSQGRIRFESFNSIAMGHLGSMLALVSLSNLILGRDKFISLIGLCLGLWLLVEAYSRGPLVAFLISFLFLLYVKNYKVLFFLYL